MPADCIFCKIATGEIKSEMVDRDEKVFVIKDIHPQAPVHLLVIPFEHIASVAEIMKGKADLIGRMTLMANKAAADAGIAGKGYRLTINCGGEGGQTVGHLHMHVLGGRQMRGGMG
ncbi:MAG: histidine triad nucleotide-binding protein [Chloroflexi bacterium]|nr:histidine triad nucleotide-binding protein [Chloroflexota bacterium]